MTGRPDQQYAPRRQASSSSSPSHGRVLRLPPMRELPSYCREIGYQAIDTFLKLSLRAKAVLCLLGLVYAGILFVFLRLGTKGFFQYMVGFSQFFSQSSLGPLLIVILIAILSFPPTIGYGTSITLCGLAFASPRSGAGHSLFWGWLVAATGCLVGSCTAFMVCRWALHTHASHWEWVRKVREGREWKAMERAVERKGWKMIILIRFCPFPFVYSNLFFASLRPNVVPIPIFLFATLLTTPKLLLHVFVGGQVFEAIQSGQEAGQAVEHNWLSLAYIAAASVLGIVTSWYIYRETKQVLDQYAEEGQEEQLLQDEEEGRRGGDSEGPRRGGGFGQSSVGQSQPRGGTDSPKHRSSNGHAREDAQEPAWDWSDDEGSSTPKVSRDRRQQPEHSYRDSMEGDSSRRELANGSGHRPLLPGGGGAGGAGGQRKDRRD